MIIIGQSWSDMITRYHNVSHIISLSLEATIVRVVVRAWIMKLQNEQMPTYISGYSYPNGGWNPGWGHHGDGGNWHGAAAAAAAAAHSGHHRGGHGRDQQADRGSAWGAGTDSWGAASRDPIR